MTMFTITTRGSEIFGSDTPTATLADMRDLLDMYVEQEIAEGAPTLTLSADGERVIYENDGDEIVVAEIAE